LGLSPQHSQPQPQSSWASVTSVIDEQPQEQVCVIVMERA
jgi:hypothetical protein